MRVRCRAAADFRGNTLGHLELEDTAKGLLVSYLGVCQHREGYAPGPLTRGVQVCVPWQSVYATRVGDEHMLLSVDARFTPLNRFFLADFSHGDPPLVPERRRRRRVVRISAAGALALTLIVAWLILPDRVPDTGAATALGIAGCAALLILLFGIAAEQWVAPTPLPSRLVLAEFVQCLSPHLLGHVPVEVPTPETRALGIADLQAILPRSVVGIAVTLTATSLAALVTSAATRPSQAQRAALETSSVRRDTMTTQSLAPLPPDPKSSALPPSAAPPTRPKVPFGAPCRCERHDSILWHRPVPRLSPLVISRQDRPHKAHNHIDLELAAVNNGDRSLEKLNVAVSFYEIANGQKGQTVERTLYFEGPLGPGRAIKWQVEGRGTGFDVLAPDLGALDEDGSDAAPAEAFATLTAAHHRPVRMHAAMLLAYLGDPRGRTAARELANAGRDDESSYLGRVLDSSSGLEVCHAELTATADQRYALRACVFNRDDPDPGAPRLRIRWLQTGVDPRSPRAEPPVVLAEYQRRLADQIPRGEGREVELSVEPEGDTARSARSFEVIADHTELPE